MINKINHNQVQNLVNGLSTGKTAHAGSKTAQDADLLLNTNNLIDQAMQKVKTEDVNLEKIKELINSGKLDTPENIRKAAGNMIDFGI